MDRDQALKDLLNLVRSTTEDLRRCDAGGESTFDRKQWALQAGYTLGVVQCGLHRIIEAGKPVTTIKVEGADEVEKLRDTLAECEQATAAFFNNVRAVAGAMKA